MKTWINSLLEGERDEAGRGTPLDESQENYWNGYRPRWDQLFRFGRNPAESAAHRNGEFASQWLPERKGQGSRVRGLVRGSLSGGTIDDGPSADLGEAPGHKYDTQQISHIVGRATTELEAWRRRSLRVYKFLYLDGASARFLNGPPFPH